MPRAGELALEGEYWTVVFGGRELRIRDSKGMRYLAELLARPGRDVSALELYGAPTAGAEPVLDETAKRAYRQRVRELRQEIEEAEAFHDPERAARARIEHEAIVGELAAATGLGHRDRRTGSPAERARLNVTRAIRAAIERLGHQDRALGEHLTASVHTGRVCVYRPDAPVRWTVDTQGSRPRVGARPPETRYARSGDVSIAYQVLGRGPPDLVFVPGFLSHVDWQWTFPAPARFFRRLAAFSRLILYDKRGQGASDRPAGVPTLEQDMEDLAAVLDAAGSERAALFGYSEGGPMSALFAATHPDRVSALALSDSFASGRRWLAVADALGVRVRERVRDMLGHWGEGRGLGMFAPSAADPEQARRFGAFERAVGSPGAVAARWETCSRIDVAPVLAAVSVPALVLHRADDRTVPAALGRELADAIPAAEYVEVPGIDHIPWAGDPEPMLERLAALLAHHGREPAGARVLTLVRVDGGHDRLLREHAERWRGTVAARLIMFDGPARAIHCARAIVRDADLRAGVHTGIVSAADPGGAAADVTERIVALAAPGEVLVSATVTDLVAGSGIRFEERGRLEDDRRVFAVRPR